MVQVENIQFAYRGAKPLFKDLSLTLQPGNVYGLLGRNGAGKSSLLRLMGGLLFPQQGSCKFGPHLTSRRDPAFLQEVFFIPETFEFPSVPIRDYVRVNAPFYPKFDTAQFDRYLDEFELLPSQKLTELSHGQKKKVFTGFALATNASLLLLDEPTNGLDIPSKAQFRRLIASAIDESRVVVVSTHQVRDLDNLIDPLIILDQSRILLHASLARIGEVLSFSSVNDLTDASEGLLYSEPSLRGYATVGTPNGRPSDKIDLELLFNAALHQPDQFKRLF